MRSSRTIIAVVIVALVLTSSVLLVFALASGPPAEDASVYASDATETTNDDILRVWAGDTGCNQERWSYLKWNLPDSDITDPSEIDSAKMILTVRATSGDLSQANVALYQVTDDSWSETSVNSGNAPADGSLIEEVSAPTALPSTVEFTAQALVDFLKQEAGGDNVASFAVRLTGNCGNSTAALNFYSKDQTQTTLPKPALQILDTNAVTLSTFSANDGQPNWPLIAGLFALVAVVVVGIGYGVRRSKQS